MATTATKTGKKLYLVFGLANGKNLTLSIDKPKNNISSEAVAPVMEQAVTNNVLRYGNSLATSAIDAYVRSTETLDLNTEGV